MHFLNVEIILLRNSDSNIGQLFEPRKFHLLPPCLKEVLKKVIPLVCDDSLGKEYMKSGTETSHPPWVFGEYYIHFQILNKLVIKDYLSNTAISSSRSSVASLVFQHLNWFAVCRFFHFLPVGAKIGKVEERKVTH